MATAYGETEQGVRSPLLQALRGQPSRALAIGSTAASRLILEGPSLITAVMLREASGASAAPTFLTGAATGAAAALAPALAAQGAGLTDWLTGFTVTGAGATAASVIVVTVTGLLGGTLSYDLAIPAGAAVGVTPLQVNFPWPGLPAANPNAAITLNVPSFGVGNLQAAAELHGYSVPANSFQVPGSLALPLVGDILDGQDAKGEEVIPFALPLGGAINQSYGEAGPLLKRGLWLNLTSGTVQGAIWVKYTDRP